MNPKRIETIARLIPQLLNRVSMFAGNGALHMKRFLTLMSAGIAAGLMFSGPAQAASGSVTVKAKVLKPVQLTGGGTINLGTIVSPSLASYSGTFTVAPSTTQSGSYCAANFSCTGTPTAAIFNIQGSKQNPISVTIPLSVSMALQGFTGGGATPTLVLATTNSLGANNTSGVYTVTLPNSGTPGLDFYIGGSVTINQNTAGGDYEGTFTVTADYQ